ncbi:TetR/AcrR family transcriptional regulator [Spirillospora sp. CA-294931]|uniref:TetR/AcrR family transcriptional regulator n=1 Tax=Spirillospora sp. CA-294931 TaxID=3240042 RepID=UPI003D9279EE
MSSLVRIRRAAVRLFAANGFAATGIREIAREAGLNSATLYHYAGNKEALLTEVMRTCLEELLRAGRAALDPPADPPVQLVRLVRAHVAAQAVNPLTARVTDREVRALGGANHALVMSLRDDYESLFRQVLERGVRTGVFHVTDVGIARLALLEMCNGVANWYRPGGRLDVPELQDRFAELACALVGARPVAAHGPEAAALRLDSEPLEPLDPAEVTP